MAIKEVKKPEDLVPENEKETETENPKTDEKVKKPNVFKRIGHGIKTGVQKVRESPAAALIGAVAGAVATGAAVVATEIIKARHAAQDQDLLEEAEPIEQEFEEEPEAEDEPSEEEEVQEEVA